MMRVVSLLVIFLVVGCVDEPEPPKVVPITLDAPPAQVESQAPTEEQATVEPVEKESVPEPGPSKNKRPLAQPQPQPQPQPQSQPQPVPIVPSMAKPEASPPAYNTMRKIKLAVRAGKISRAQYDAYQAEIQRKRQVEYDATKRRYREGKITRDQYNQTIRRIRAKYEG